MNFGKVENPLDINFSFPKDHARNREVLSKNKEGIKNIAVGCPTWSKSNLIGFYPKPLKDELTYYSRQFDAIELNATYYKMPSAEQINTWKNKTPKDFKFFPKITNSISHYRRLINVDDLVTQFATSVLEFGERLGVVFLQLHDNYKPNDYERLEIFIKKWPQEVPLAVEIRSKEWFVDEEIYNKVTQLFEDYNITNIIVDTPGRRDVLHMRLTSQSAFIRFVACNNLDLDKKRLDDWITRLSHWKKEGLQNVFFFVHQNYELTPTFLSAYFIKELNISWKTKILIPQLASTDISPTLFG
ncbi:DUF72 domain-containing protein [Chryseobacterium sp.]|uniref:DUF72 domain-containing protein n=1 Tax=Chryseobacterium sp. TaxID=1871047 RepID=UPI00388CED3B